MQEKITNSDTILESEINYQRIKHLKVGICHEKTVFAKA